MKAVTPSNTTTSSQLTTVLSYGAILLLGYSVFLIAEPFLVPLAWSAVLAVFFYPLHEKLLRKLKPSAAAMTSTLGVTLLLIVPALVVLVYTARDALMVHGQGPNEGLVMRAEEWIRMRLPDSWRGIEMSDPVQQAAEKIASFLGTRFAGLLKNLVSFFVDLFILIFALFFMFRDGQEIVHGAKHLLPFDEEIQTDMVEESKELIFASVAVGLLVAAIQGVLGGVSFALVRLSSPIFWGVLIAFFSLVPVVGSALIWGPAALWLGLTGHWGKALVVMLICGGVSTVADNIVRPMLLRNRTRLNELLLFIGVLGGLEAFGLLGLVAGPTIVAAAMGVFRVYMQHRDELSTKGA
jgi:predicted PurR-regulated permease PerM